MNVGLYRGMIGKKTRPFLLIKGGQHWARISAVDRARKRCRLPA